MNILKLSVLASLAGLSGYANAAVSSSADVTITGSINGSNQCTIAIDGGGALDANVNHIDDLASEGGIISEFKTFNTAVGCTFPTAIAVKYSTSLAPDTLGTHKLGYFATSTDKQAGHLYAELGVTPPTAGGVDHAYAGVGDQDLTTISSADTFAASPAGTPISGVAGHVQNAYTVIDSNNNPVAASAFVLPFNIGVHSADKSSGWHNDVADGILSLSATVTVELHTL